MFFALFCESRRQSHGSQVPRVGPRPGVVPGSQGGADPQAPPGAPGPQQLPSDCEQFGWRAGRSSAKCAFGIHVFDLLLVCALACGPGYTALPREAALGELLATRS